MKRLIIFFSILLTIVVHAQEPPTNFFSLSFFPNNIVANSNEEFVYGEIIKSSRNDKILFKERHTQFQRWATDIKEGKLIYLKGNDPSDYDDRLFFFKLINKNKENVYLYIYYKPFQEFDFNRNDSRCEHINIFKYGIGFDFLNVEKGTYLIDMRNQKKISKKIVNNRKILINQLEKKIEDQKISYTEDKIKYFYRNENIKNSQDSLNYYRKLYKEKTALHDKWVLELLQNKDPYMGYFETEVKLRESFDGIRTAKDYYNTKSSICTLIGEFDTKYIIKQKLIERLKISEEYISIDDLEKNYKSDELKNKKTIKKILSVFEVDTQY